ncbi:drug resistance transporter, EmrB/QacA subfamily [Nocardioides scoriae]|uniref:Drug resistance transporter, EmrB/QacA subfamily n=1 Tax=Nocardioides scoriae TaxID=642780 RepID=A0A1H1Y6Y8_9ACTN|nr:MFS transporter [Nocardioides scoriae]SDT16989.1 drug resistance transporter, EmrB/QacA subfamily [Nocardioides scoriae]
MTDVREPAPPLTPGPDATPTEEPGGSTRLGWALLLISVAQLMVVLDATIANIALPYIQSDLDISQANLQWVVTGYALAFGGLLLLGGRLGDLYGRRRIFMVGVAIFAVASGVGGLAANEAMLLASRGLQGLGAALASPAALALITTNFPAGPQRNRAFSIYAAMSGAGAAVGLLLGGWLTGLTPDLFGASVDGWRLTFLINVPIGLAAAFAAPRVLAESESHPGELDVPGALSGTAGLVAIVFGLSRAGEPSHGWGDPSTLTALVLGVLLLGAFVAIERRVEHPLLPFRILLSRTRATAFVTMMIVPAAMFAMFYFLSQFVQNVMGYSPLQTGVAFLPFSLGIVIAATVSSKLMAMVDPRWIAGIGTAMAGAALFGFSRLSVDSSAGSILSAVTGGETHLGTDVSYWASIFPYISLMSLGMGATFVPMTLAAVHGVSHRDSGIGSGVLNTMQQVGGALGLAALSTVAVHFSTDRATQITSDLQAAGQASGVRPTEAMQQAVGNLAYQGAFTDGATNAFLAGAFMIWAASLIVWIFLSVRHEELAVDDAPAGVHAG